MYSPRCFTVPALPSSSSLISLPACLVPPQRWVYNLSTDLLQSLYRSPRFHRARPVLRCACGLVLMGGMGERHWREVFGGFLSLAREA